MDFFFGSLELMGKTNTHTHTTQREREADDGCCCCWCDDRKQGWMAESLTRVRSKAERSRRLLTVQGVERTKVVSGKLAQLMRLSYCGKR